MKYKTEREYIDAMLEESKHDDSPKLKMSDPKTFDMVKNMLKNPPEDK